MELLTSAVRNYKLHFYSVTAIKRAQADGVGNKLLRWCWYDCVLRVSRAADWNQTDFETRKMYSKEGEKRIERTELKTILAHVIETCFV